MSQPNRCLKKAAANLAAARRLGISEVAELFFAVESHRRKALKATESLPPNEQQLARARINRHRYSFRYDAVPPGQRSAEIDALYAAWDLDSFE